MAGVGARFTPDSISDLLVPGTGGEAIMANMGLDPNIDTLGLSVIIGRTGGNLSACQWWLTGSCKIAKFDIRALWPEAVDQDESAKLCVRYEPRDLLFQRNAVSTDWASGRDMLNSGEFKLEGASDINHIKTLEWVYRYGLEVTPAINGAVLFLHLLPISLARLQQLVDPNSSSLAVLKLCKRLYLWAKPQEQLRFPGPQAYFFDARSLDAVNDHVWPSSMDVKLFIRAAALAAQPLSPLTSAELALLTSDESSFPPLRAASLVTWPLPAVEGPEAGPSRFLHGKSSGSKVSVPKHSAADSSPSATDDFSSAGKPQSFLSSKDSLVARP